MRVCLATVLFLLIFCCSCNKIKEKTKDVQPSTNQVKDTMSIKDELWKKELAYWENLKNKDFNKYKSSLHTQFTDWPASANKPIESPDSMVTFVSKTINNFIEIDFELNHQLTSVVSSDEVIVYFHCKVSGILVDSTKVTSLNRMIHVWRKDKDTFKLIGGLQSEIE